MRPRGHVIGCKEGANCCILTPPKSSMQRLRACIRHEVLDSLRPDRPDWNSVNALLSRACDQYDSASSTVDLLHRVGLQENKITSFFFDKARDMDEGKGMPGHCAMGLVEEAICAAFDDPTFDET